MISAGVIISVALRDGPGRMREVTEAHADVGGGLRGDHRTSPDRGVTLLALPQWLQVTRELGVELPWHTRRANVLVDAATLGELIGKTLRLGDVRLHITGETQPCDLMDRLHPGLRAALKPDCRGGVHGRVLAGGMIRAGDRVEIE